MNFLIMAALAGLALAALIDWRLLLALALIALAVPAAHRVAAVGALEVSNAYDATVEVCRASHDPPAASCLATGAKPSPRIQEHRRFRQRA